MRVAENGLHTGEGCLRLLDVCEHMDCRVRSIEVDSSGRKEL